jgi:hypothetical protein
MRHAGRTTSGFLRVGARNGPASSMKPPNWADTYHKATVIEDAIKVP